MFALEEQHSRRLSKHLTARYRPKSRCPETAGASSDIGGAPPNHCDRLHIPGGRDVADQLRRITEDVISAGRVESAAVYCEAELNASAMALGSLGHHAPVSVERRGNGGRSGAGGCGNGR